MSGTPASDEDIVALVRRGDVERFGELMERYEPKLRRYGARFLARTDDISDLVQDIFVQTYQHLQNFDSSLRFSPWIYRIAHNAFVNELRRKSRRPLILPDFDIVLSHTQSTESAEGASEHHMLERMVEKGLSQVPEKFREILILYFMEGLSYKEISDVLRIPVGTVGVRLTREKKALRAVYKAQNMTYEQ